MNECVLQLNFHPRLLGPFEGGERGRDARIRKAGMCRDIYTRTCPYSKSWQSKPFYKWLEILSSFDIKKQEKERLISIPKWSPNWKVQLSWCRQREKGLMNAAEKPFCYPTRFQGEYILSNAISAAHWLGKNLINDWVFSLAGLFECSLNGVRINSKV